MIKLTTTTNGKTLDIKQAKNKTGSLLSGTQSLKMSCPLCDTRRSGPCNHKRS